MKSKLVLSLLIFGCCLFGLSLQAQCAGKAKATASTVAKKKASCDPAKCDLSKCTPNPNCDPAKCAALKTAAAGKPSCVKAQAACVEGRPACQAKKTKMAMANRD